MAGDEDDDARSAMERLSLGSISSLATRDTNSAPPLAGKKDFKASVSSADLNPDVEREELAEEPRSIILALIAQLRKGTDLHRIAFPTFVLEPRSLLERITDFMSHPRLIIETPREENPIARFVDVVRYYLSGWHFRPKGVKKPYNPVLGEFFRCHWICPDGSKAFYVAEQVSHHPPISAYLYANPECGIVASGTFRPRSKFLGNSIVSLMDGNTSLHFLDRPGEEYILTYPNVYGRGILFGPMLLELGDTVSIECRATGLRADIEFKVKGFFTGCYNAISGTIGRMDSDRMLYNISGKWSETINLQQEGSRESPIVLFNALDEPRCAKIVAGLENQDAFESRHLWANVTDAILQHDLDRASDEKALVEDNQRTLTKLRDDDGICWRPKFFVGGPDGEWHFLDRHIFSESREVMTEHLCNLMTRRDFDFTHQHPPISH